MKIKNQVYEIPFELWMIILEHVDLFDLLKFGYLFVDIETTFIDINNYKNKNENNKKCLNKIFDETLKNTIRRLSKKYINPSIFCESNFLIFYETYGKIIKELIIDKNKYLNIIHVFGRKSGKTTLSLILLDLFYKSESEPILFVQTMYTREELRNISQYKENIQSIQRGSCLRKGIVIIVNKMNTYDWIFKYVLFPQNIHNKIIWIQQCDRVVSEFDDVLESIKQIFVSPSFVK